MKKIGFLSFGHWANHPSYQARMAGDTLLQSIDLAVELRSWVWMVPISVYTISPNNWLLHFLCWRQLEQRQAR
ncbi:hypothetical protein ACLI09_15600 [Flavobacterium sp. RHBU_24]|uniref:hypothetical protein n=1 Tax=Flavobacterium sp. RHBU_24 TaxID=3391185 RepID=UPI0039854D85